MQYLKDDVKQKIINSAITEFRKNGYQGASMREIAANASIVSGNIYRYFKNKEDLFNCTVEPTCKYLQKLELDFQKDMEEDAVNSMGDNNHRVVERISAKIIEAFLEYGTELEILLENSEGTKYAGIKENLKQVVSKSMHDNYLVELKRNGKNIEDDFIFDIFSSSFIDGICLILKSISDGTRIKKLIESWVEICFYDLHERI